MEIENLTKSQTILLTLLVSFVTSIATGIVTVTLMDQAPPAITQTIHKVVEKTVETITPNTQIASSGKEIVIVKEENFITDVVDKNTETFVRIDKITEGGNSFAGFGIFVDKSGIILTDGGTIIKGANYFITAGGNDLKLEVVSFNKDKNVAYLKIVDSKLSFKKVNIADSDSLKLGQSIVVLTGINSTEIFTGIISGLTRDSIKTASTTEQENFVSNIKTNILNTSIISGVPIFNLKGDVIGINTGSLDGSFIPLDFVKSDIKEILNTDI